MMAPREEKDTPCVILLVEDDPAHAELIKRGFESLRIPPRIIHVAHGEAALDYLFRRGVYEDAFLSPRPHLILLDLRLPRMNGFDVLEAIKTDADLCSLPVIVLTTSLVRADIVKAYALYANSVLAKPSDFEQFTALINALGSYWLNWNYTAGSPETAAASGVPTPARSIVPRGLEKTPAYALSH